MFRRNRADREFRETQRAGQAVLAMHTEWPQPDAPRPVAAPVGQRIERAPKPEPAG